METTEKTVAQIILSQLGGNKFRVMTGATNFIDGGNHLTFQFKGSRKMNICMITLTEDDMYNMDFYLDRSRTSKLVAWTHGIFNSDLQEVFQNTTGLATHL